LRDKKKKWKGNTMVRTVHAQRRGCGYPKEGGYYLVSEGEEDGVLPLFVEIDPPIPTREPHTRSYVEVNGDNILKRLPESEWAAGATKDRQDRDSWAVDWLGMPLSKRKKFGVCEGLSDEGECLDMLLEVVKYRPGYTFTSVQNMSKMGVANLCPEAFASTVKNIQRYLREKDKTYLVKAVAAVHRMPREAGTRQAKVKPHVMAILQTLNLGADALDIARGYRASLS
jgi:hypothetical protein